MKEETPGVGIDVRVDHDDVGSIRTPEGLEKTIGPRSLEGLSGDAKTKTLGVRQHVLPMRFRAAARDEKRLYVGPAQGVDAFHGTQPMLVRVPAGHLGERRAPVQESREIPNRGSLGGNERLGRDPVGQHERVHTQGPHAFTHVATHGGDDGSLVEALPVDVIEPEYVVRSPEDRHDVAKAASSEEPVEVEHTVHRVPFLGEDDHWLASCAGGGEVLLDEPGWQGSGEVIRLAGLAIVDARGVISAEPLAPAMEGQAALYLLPWELRVADEPEVRGETLLGERGRHSGDARGDSSGAGVGIRTFEGEECGAACREVLFRGCSCRNET